MPYHSGKRLPGETASRLGHLDVLKSELVNELCWSFDELEDPEALTSATWENVEINADRLPLIFGIDGSLQTIQYDTPPYKALSFVKTALLRLDEYALSRVDKDSPNPFALRDILTDSALYHATVFPLRNVSIPNLTVYDAVRKIIFESMQDASLNGEPYETLKWLVYEKWDATHKNLPEFECPHCGSNRATLPFDADKGKCVSCGNELLLTDMLGFHLDMAEDAASESIATAYMNIHETLLLFTGVRHFWQKHRNTLSNYLFVKDGPLSIRAQYSKLVAPIRRFLNFAFEQGVIVHIIGQEKTGRFVDHLELIKKSVRSTSIFIPSDSYIKQKVYRKPDRGAPYGQDTNYGAKVFVNIGEYHQMVVSIPTFSNRFVPNPTKDDLIGFDRIVATLPKILSYRFEGGLLPIELAHGVASLSTYPSAQILKIFATSH